MRTTQILVDLSGPSCYNGSMDITTALKVVSAVASIATVHMMFAEEQDSRARADVLVAQMAHMFVDLDLSPENVELAKSTLKGYVDDAND